MIHSGAERTFYFIESGLNFVLILAHTRTHTHTTHGYWCCERPSISAPLGPCNTWPGKGRKREYGGKREGRMYRPGDAGKDWQTTGSPSGLCHRSASVSPGAQRNKDKPDRGCQSVYVCFHVGLYCVSLCFCVHEPDQSPSLSTPLHPVCVWEALQGPSLLHMVLEGY